MEITRVRASWAEQQGFFLDRPDLGDQCIFLHYLSPVRVLVNGKLVDAGPGDCILFGKHSRQYFFSPDTPLLHDWFHITGDVETLAGRYGLTCNEIYHIADSPALTRIIRRMEEEFLTRPPFYKEHLPLLAEEVFLLVARAIHSENRLAGISRDTVKELLNLRTLITNRCELPWTVDIMAQNVGFSSSRFCTLYRAVFQTSPKQDLTEIRLERARLLLAQNRYTVSQIAQLTGYTNPYHFIRAFRAHEGITPGQYMRKHGTADAEENRFSETFPSP